MERRWVNLKPETWSMCNWEGKTQGRQDGYFFSFPRKFPLVLTRTFFLLLFSLLSLSAVFFSLLLHFTTGERGVLHHHHHEGFLTFLLSSDKTGAYWSLSGFVLRKACVSFFFFSFSHCFFRQEASQDRRWSTGGTCEKRFFKTEPDEALSPLGVMMRRDC